MAVWSSARPQRGDRCKYTERFKYFLKAHYEHLLDRRGIVRLLDSNGNASVRWDDVPGELDVVRLTILVREDHEDGDPLDETVEHVTEMVIRDYNDV